MFSRFLLLFSGLILAMSLAACSKFGGGGTAWTGDVQKAHQLAAGMTQDQVKALLGAPTSTQEMKVLSESLTAWYYVGEKDSVNVVFDTQGKLNAAGMNGQELVTPAHVE